MAMKKASEFLYIAIDHESEFTVGTDDDEVADRLADKGFLVIDMTSSFTDIATLADLEGDKDSDED